MSKNVIRSAARRRRNATRKANTGEPVIPDPNGNRAARRAAARRGILPLSSADDTTTEKDK